jgi:hypothetical protein
MRSWGLLRCTAALDALNRNQKTKSLAFSADISHGLRNALPDPERYRLKLIKRFSLKLTMSVPANFRENRLLRRPPSDPRKLTIHRRPSEIPSL